jgi:hypothetical protein
MVVSNLDTQEHKIISRRISGRSIYVAAGQWSGNIDDGDEARQVSTVGTT